MAKNNITVPEVYHVCEIELTIDKNIRVELSQKLLTLPAIEFMLDLLERKKVSKVPVIGLFDIFSVMALWNQKTGSYQLSKAWNGKILLLLFLSLSKVISQEHETNS